MKKSEGRFAGTVRVGEKGQIVIPKGVFGPSEINHFESGEINQNRSNKNRQFDSCYFMKAPK